MTDADALFDSERQQKLADQIGHARFQTMLARLAERIETSIADAGALALSPSGLPALRAEAHAVAGLAANFGAVSLANHARQLEYACQSGDQAAVGAVLDSFLQTAKKTLSALRA